MWKVQPTEFLKRTLNPIRILWETNQPKGNPEIPNIYLQLGDPTIYGNFLPHSNCAKAISYAVLHDKFSYLESSGLKEAREAVAEYCKHMGNVTADDVFLTTGCSMAIETACRALANPGENILTPEISWNYTTWMNGVGIEARGYSLLPEKEWEIDLDHLESLIDDKTRAIVVNSPGNPCGNVHSKKHILEIIALAERNRLVIISDEIYEFFTMPNVEYHSFAELSENVPVLVCSGLTKRFLIPGARCDWLVVNDRGNKLENLRTGFRNAAGRNFFPNSSLQYALPSILRDTPQSFFDENNQKIYKNAQIVFNKLKSVKGLKSSIPKGSFYMLIGIDLNKFPKIETSLQFMQMLADEQSVFVLPSECFNYQGFIRIVLTATEEMLAEASDRIKKFCECYYEY
ncbi:hypothetical protein ACKWTF_005219 [Chironomus riparius]